MTRDPREEQDVSDVPEAKASASAPSEPSGPVMAGEPSGTGARRSRAAARGGRACPAARDGDPFPTPPEFAQRVRRAWMWTGVLLLGIVAGLLLSGFDANPGRLLANFRAHVFSVDAWPISVAQYLLLALWPVAVYWGARLLGWDRWASVAAAAVAPLVVSAPGYGYEHESYTWQGRGVYSQLWAMWLLPVSLGLTWRCRAGVRSTSWSRAG